MAFGGETNARTRLWTRGSQTVVAFVHAAQKRRRVIVIAAVVLTLVGGIVTFGIFRYLKAEAAETVVRGYGSLYQCLLGPPLREGESASARFRGIQLTALTQSDISRTSKEAPPWPDRCATHAYVLQEGVSASAISDTDAGQKLLTAALKLAEALSKKDSFFADLSNEVEALFGAAGEAGIAALEVPGVPSAPAAAQPLTVDALSGVLSEQATDLAAIGSSNVVEGTARILVTDPAVKRSPFSCAFAPGKAVCRTLGKPAAEAGKLALRGSSGAGVEPLIFGDKAVYRAQDGAVVLDRPALSGHLAADGVVDLLAATGTRLSWIRIDNGKRREQPLLLGGGVKVSEPIHDLALLGEHVLALVSRRDVSLLVASRIDGQRLAPASEIGVLDGFTRAAGTSIDGCRSDGGVVVRVQGAGASYLSFWMGSRWSAPIKAAPGLAKLACKGQQATLSRHRAGAEGQLDGTLDVQSCTPTGCTTTSSSMAQLLAGELGLAPPSVIELVGIDTSSLFGWLAGQRGGLRLRLASPDQLGSANDIIAYDDLSSAGKVQSVSTLSEVRALAASGYAVMLVSTTNGLRALTVDAAGKLEPVAVSWR